MAGIKRGLGRGLGALFGDDTVEEVIAKEKAAVRKRENTAGDARKKTENHAVNKNQNSKKNTELKNAEQRNAEQMNAEQKNTELKNPEQKNAVQKNTELKNAEQKNAEQKNVVQKDAVQKNAEQKNAEQKNVVQKNTVQKNAEQKNAELRNAEQKNAGQKNEKKEAQVSEKDNSDVVKEAPQRQNKEEELQPQTELELKISEIEPNQDQPRKAFDQEQMEELADSIRKYGVLQPLLVQKKGESYEIIAGERRWRAAKLAGLKTIPVVIREYSPQQAMEIALIENVQREDLNPIEEALAYQRLMQEFSLKQEEIAERVSKNRTTITNSMRLLNLVPEVQQMLVEGRITSGHARALLAVADPDQQLELAKKVELERMSVREIEKAVKLLGKEKKEKKKSQVDEAVELVFQDMENRMKTVMGTKVNISRKDKTKGKIEIEYYSEAELERLVELIESIQPV